MWVSVQGGVAGRLKSGQFKCKLVCKPLHLARGQG